MNLEQPATLTVNYLPNFIRALQVLFLLTIGSWGAIELILGICWRIIFNQQSEGKTEANKRIFIAIIVLLIVFFIFILQVLTYKPGNSSYPEVLY